MPHLLEVEKLVTSFRTEQGWLPILNHVTFDLMPGDSLGIVGESGSGKSVLALSIMGLLPAEVAQVSHGAVRLNGEELLSKRPKQWASVRGKHMGMIFQEPMTSLNPVFSIGYQLGEVFRLHEQQLSQHEVRDRVIDVLKQVRIPHPEHRVKDYPHHLSGGMRQRVMIAMAIACRPKLLIADEPTTALDVTIQAQILDLIAELQQSMQMGLIFISHDLGVIRRVASETMVLYAGSVVEKGKTADLLQQPQHPYTVGLLQARPKIGSHAKLLTIPGMVPGITELKGGCRFAARCPRSEPKCVHQEPALQRHQGELAVSCWHPVLQPQQREKLWHPHQ